MQIVRVWAALAVVAGCGQSPGGTGVASFGTGGQQPPDGDSSGGNGTANAESGEASSGSTSVDATSGAATNATASSTSSSSGSSSGSSTGKPVWPENPPGCTPAAACDGVAVAPGVGAVGAAAWGCAPADFELAWTWDRGGDSSYKAVPVLADVDGDDALDIVMNPRLTSGQLAIGDGDGTFGDPTPLPDVPSLGGWGMDVGDFDGDGDVDLLLGDHNIGARILEGDGLGAFAATSAGLPEGEWSGAGFVDLDADGLLDAAFGADQFGTGIAVGLFGGASGWSAPAAAGLPPYVGDSFVGAPTNAGSFAFADFDGDGSLDIAAIGQLQSAEVRVWIYANNGDATAFAEAEDLQGPSLEWIGSAHQGTVGDVDCDGRPDIAVGGYVWLNRDPWERLDLVDGSHLSHLADVNADGWLDLVTHSDTRGLRVYLNDAEDDFVQWELGLPDDDFTQPGAGRATLVQGIDLGDVDGDGALDVVRWYGVDTLASGGPGHYLEVWN